ncbi:MAG TPA: hypothetical protein VGS11_05470 [Candidatus Bathyarchaeia archaeon]|nr:hypothetical protein [Candidatus Bathyarchaeia archaeon]
MQPLSLKAALSGLVWIICGLVVMVTKVGFFANSSSAYWEYLGGFMILFGLIRLFLGLIRGTRKTKPGFWSRVI